MYLGHRRFLPTRYLVRRKGKYFKGEADHRQKPIHRTGEVVFAMVNNLKLIFGKGPRCQPVPNEANRHAPCGRRNLYFGSYPIGNS
jgi:hypothetical protein